MYEQQKPLSLHLQGFIYIQAISSVTVISTMDESVVKVEFALIKR